MAYFIYYIFMRYFFCETSDQQHVQHPHLSLWGLSHSLPSRHVCCRSMAFLLSQIPFHFFWKFWEFIVSELFSRIKYLHHEKDQGLQTRKTGRQVLRMVFPAKPKPIWVPPSRAIDRQDQDHFSTLQLGSTSQNQSQEDMFVEPGSGLFLRLPSGGWGDASGDGSERSSGGVRGSKRRRLPASPCAGDILQPPIVWWVAERIRGGVWVSAPRWHHHTLPDIGVRERTDEDRRLSGLPKNDAEAALLSWLPLLTTMMMMINFLLRYWFASNFVLAFFFLIFILFSFSLFNTWCNTSCEYM